MRLVKLVSDLEERHAERRRRVTDRVGLVWSSYDQQIPAEYVPAPGERIALDIRVVERYGDDAGDVAQWALAERITTDPQDLGVIRDADGSEIGRVVRVEGSLISWAQTETDGATLPASGPAARRRRAPAATDGPVGQ